jgi:histidyl-tRNA synthetase
MNTKNKKISSKAKAKKPTKEQKIKTIQSVKGMHDTLPSDRFYWEKFQKVINDMGDYYNFSPINTPLLEAVELFSRTSGETSDIVEKEMFTLRTKGKDFLALRPEGTASVVRSYIEHGMSHQPHPLRLRYFGPFFRYQKPQAGRLRQFHQLGLELFSHENDPIYDAQIILTTYKMIEEMKIKNLCIEINTVGCRTCRPNYKKQLQSYYKTHEKKLCKDCKKRLEKNPLRILDCKNENCIELKTSAPIILDFLCSGCKNHFKGVLEYLENLKLPYTLNNYLVRGLDYYSKTVFEIKIDPQEGEDEFTFSLAGGGRYDYLIEDLGGKSTAAVGSAIGAESVIEVMKKRDIKLGQRIREKVFLIHIGDLAKKKSLVLLENLRENKINVAESLAKESLGAQLRAADKIGSPLALIFGQKEAYEESIILRDMKTGAQEIIPLVKVAAVIKKRMQNNN